MVPMQPIKQKMILTSCFVHARKSLLASMDYRSAAVLRSCGGPGAGGFLLLQKNPDALMDNLGFKVALARRLGGGVRPQGGGQMRCQHTGRNGGCTCQIDSDGRHAETCSVGGCTIERHDRVARWLHKWLSEGRTSAPPLMEQICPTERGRLDVTFVHEGTPWWVDVAITSAASSCQRSLRARAANDGRAARDEEGIKRSRYHGRAFPFVLEAHGRPGPAALSFIRKFCRDGALGASQSAADAWAALSSTSQSGTACMVLSAYGPAAIEKGVAEIWIP